jgi:predicted metalloendopeptidase
VGHAPDEAGLAILAEKALAAVREQLGDAWRLQTRDEFVQSRLCEQSGAPAGFRFAVPEGDFAHEWAK